MKKDCCEPLDGNISTVRDQNHVLPNIRGEKKRTQAIVLQQANETRSLSCPKPLSCLVDQNQIAFN